LRFFFCCFFLRFWASALSRTGQRRQRGFEVQHFFFGLRVFVEAPTS
jgi:hypothetical protein